MVFEVQKGSTMSQLGSTTVLSGVIGVLSGTFHRFRGVTAKAAAAFRADEGRESLGFRIRKRIHHDIFDPVGVATRTAAVFVPFAGVRVELQELVHDGVGHSVAPQLFPRTVRTL